MKYTEPQTNTDKLFETVKLTSNIKERTKLDFDSKVKLFEIEVNTKEDKTLFTSKDLITHKTMKIFFKYGVSKISKFIAKASDYYDGTMTYEAECKGCKNIYVINTNKQTMYDYITAMRSNNNTNDYKLFTCSQCKRKLAKPEKESKEQMLKGTAKFIDLYLKPKKKLDANLSKRTFWIMRNQVDDCNVEKIAEHIKNMNYYDFLKTPYWKIISWYVKALSDFKCKLCGSGDSLATHHSTYEHHGYEIHRYKKDLICLCNNCHEKFHDAGANHEY